MKTHKIWANYTVADLDRTTQFYTRIGFKPNGASNDLTSFMVGDDDFVIHFFLKHVMEANTHITIANTTYGNEIIFTLSADTREEVDAWEQEVMAAGGKIVSPAEEFGPGYYGFVFADPDGHKFNVFYM